MPLRTHNFATVLAGAQPRCSALYQPTHRHPRANGQDSIRKRNLVEELERALLEPSLEAEVADFLAPFDAREHDVAYWTKALEEQDVCAVPRLS